LRTGELPEFPIESEKSVDFVVIGGGIAGLTAAHKLASSNVLLLEQYDNTGGHAQGSRFQNIDYSRGSVFISSIEGIYGQLYDQLGLKPVQLPPDHRHWYWNQQWIAPAQAEAKDFQLQLDRLLKQARPIASRLTNESVEFGTDLAQLDATTFAGELKDYPEQFLSLVDSFCRTSYCAGISQISALAGYAALSELINPCWSFPGGNKQIVEALRNTVDKAGTGRIMTNAFVWKVQQNDKGASVIFSTGDGRCHRIQCKHAILATPPLVAARQLQYVDDRLRAQLLMFKFGSYLVANCLLNKNVFDRKETGIISPPFTFCRIVSSPGAGGKDMPSVLTISQPYAPGSDGRALLLAGDRKAFAEQIANEMEKIAPGFSSCLDEVELTRWGHALAIASPGYFGRLNKMQTTWQRFSLAHSSLTGGPSVEAAIKGGLSCAEAALKSKKDAGMITVPK
jgi:protoporphyrinogen oxidase